MSILHCGTLRTHSNQTKSQTSILVHSMTNITKTHTEALTSSPQSIVRSYSGGREIVTINLNIQQQPSTRQADALSIDGETAEAYECTTISVLRSGSKLTENDVVKIIVQQGVFASIDTAFLKCLVTTYNIPDYDALVAVLVSGRYTYADELAIHRKALLGDEKSLAELNAYVEQCKQLAAACFSELHSTEA